MTNPTTQRQEAGPETLPVITRPNGKPYRPRRVVAETFLDMDEAVAGVVVFGTHNVVRARLLAEHLIRYETDTAITDCTVELVWWRDGFESGFRRFVDDADRGRAGVKFQIPPWDSVASLKVSGPSPCR